MFHWTSHHPRRLDRARAVGRHVAVVTALFATAATMGCSRLFGDCGPGTVMVDGTCVIDQSAVLPNVDAVTLTRLHVEGDGLFPLMVLHEARVEVGIEVQAEAFKSNVIVGLSSADGKQHCALGYMTLEHEGPTQEAADADADADAKPKGAYKLAKTFQIQQSCAALAGTGLKAWVAFDPFERTWWKARKESKITDEDGKLKVAEADAIAALLSASTLPMELCAAGTGSVHPENCATDIELVVNAGRDVQLTALQPASVVGVVEFMGALPSKWTAPNYDFEKHIPNLGATPLVTVATDVRVYGETSTDDAGATADELEMSYQIRPAGMSDATWLALAETVQTVKPPTKGGGTTTVTEYLEQVFLGGLTTETEIAKTVPLYLTPKGRDLVLDGGWAQPTLFDLRVCAKAPFAEVNADQTAADNNCRTERIVLLRQERSFTGLPPDAKTLAATSSIDFGEGDVTVMGDTYEFGDRSKVGAEVGAGLFRRWMEDSQTMQVGAYSIEAIRGWFPLTLREFRFWLDVVHQAPDTLHGKVTAFNIELPIPSVSMPEEWVIAPTLLEKNPESPNADWPGILPGSKSQFDKSTDAQQKEMFFEDFKTFPIYGPLSATVGIRMELKLSLAVGVGKSSKPATFTAEDCDHFSTKYEACFLATDKELPFLDASDHCVAIGGHLPSDRQDITFGTTLTQTLGNAAAKRLGWPPNKRRFWTNLWSWPGVPLNPNNILANKLMHYGAQEPSTWPLYYWDSKDEPPLAPQFQEFGAGSILLGKADAAAKYQLEKNAATIKTLAGSQHFSSYWLPMSEKAAVVCEFDAGPTEKTEMEKSELFFRVQPSATLSFTGYAGASLAAVRGGAYVELKVLEAGLPVDVGHRWRTGHPNGGVRGSNFARVSLTLDALTGSIGAWYQPWDLLAFDWGKRRELPLYDWNGFRLAEVLIKEWEFAPWKIDGPGKK